MGTPLQGNDADIWYAGGTSTLVSNEACDDSGDHITYSAHTHRMWDSSKALTVQCSANGSSGWTTVTDYSFRWGGGAIVFATARSPGVNAYVRISAGYYFTLAQLGDCYAWEMSLDAQVQKATVFQGDGWEVNAAVSKSASGKLSSFRYDDTLSKDMGVVPVGMQLWIDKSANMRWELLALIQTVGPKSKVGTLIEQDAAFVAVGEVTLLLS